MPNNRFLFIDEDASDPSSPSSPSTFSSSSSASIRGSYSDQISIEDEDIKESQKRRRKGKMKPTSLPDLRYASRNRRSSTGQGSPLAESRIEGTHPRQAPSRSSQVTPLTTPQKRGHPKKDRMSNDRKGFKKLKRAHTSTNGSAKSPTSTASHTLIISSSSSRNINGTDTPIRQFCCPIADCRARPFTNYKNPCPPKALELHLRDKGQLGCQAHADAYLTSLEARMFRQGMRYASEATASSRALMSGMAWEEMIEGMGMRYLKNIDLNLYFEEIEFSGEEEMDYE